MKYKQRGTTWLITDSSLSYISKRSENLPIENLMHKCCWSITEESTKEEKETDSSIYPLKDGAINKTQNCRWSIQNRQIHRHGKQISGCLGLGKEKAGWLLTGTGLISGKMKIFKIKLWRWLYNFTVTLSNSETYIYTGGFMEYKLYFKIDAKVSSSN